MQQPFKGNRSNRQSSKNFKTRVKLADPWTQESPTVVSLCLFYVGLMKIRTVGPQPTHIRKGKGLAPIPIGGGEAAGNPGPIVAM